MSNDSTKKAKIPSNRGSKIVNELLTKDNKIIARKYRLLDGYPVDGFKDKVHYDDWLSKNIGKDTFTNFSCFMTEIIANNKEINSTISSPDYYLVFHDLYLYGVVSKEHLLELTGCECDWVTVRNSDLENGKLIKRMRTGMYIRVSLNATIKNIKDFLDDASQNDVFRYLQSILRLESGLSSKPKKIRKNTRSKAYTDEIGRLAGKTQKQLSKLSGKDKKAKKDVQIADIMTKKGLKTKDGTVRKMISKNRNSVPKL